MTNIIFTAEIMAAAAGAVRPITAAPDSYRNTRPLAAPEIRLLQAYLRTMGYFGNPEIVRGIDVVNGRLNEKTKHACEQFVADHGAGHGIRNATATEGLLAAVRVHAQGWVASGGASASARAEAELDALDRAFAQSRHHPFAAELKKTPPCHAFSAGSSIGRIGGPWRSRDTK